MNPRQPERSPDPSDLRRAEARRRLAALVAAHEELGSSPEEALEAALRQLAAEAAPARHGGLFPTFRAAVRALLGRGGDAGQAPGIGRRARRALAGMARSAAALTCLLLLVTLVANGTSGRALEEELARIRKRGEPLTLREVAPPPVPDAENAALVYEQAFRHLPRLEGTSQDPGPDSIRLDHEDDAALGLFVSGDAAKREQVTVPRVRQALAGTEEALALVRQAAAMPRCRFPVNWEDGVGALLPHLPRLRSFSRILGADAALAAIDGQPARALADLEALVGMTRHIASEPLLIGQMVEFGCLSVAQESLRRLVETTAIDEAEYRALDQTLAGADLYDPFARAVQAERCLGLWVFDVARADPARWRTMAGNQITPGLLCSAVLRPVGSPLLKMDEQFYLHLMAGSLALARRRERVSHAEWGDAELRYPWYADVTRLMLPAFSLAGDRRDEAVARLALARWGLALARFHQRTGRYPEALAEVDGILSERLPADPFSGQAFRYRRQSDGYLLYSVGVNGRDDGGQRISRSGPPATDGPSGEASSASAPPPGSSMSGQPDDVAWRIGA
jgi:hypothetical protein